MKHKTLVVIPAFNESKVIAQTIAHILDYPVDILVIDDGSTDGTIKAIEHFPIKIIAQQTNKGQGAAIKTGFGYAIENAYDQVITFDADGQHSPQNIEILLSELENSPVSICLGSRFLDPQKSIGIPFRRRMLLKVARYVDFGFSGILLSDSHNGLRIIRVSALANFHVLSNRMEHASEIIWEIKRLKLPYKEIPVDVLYTPYAHQKGQSLINAFGIFFGLFRLKFQRMFIRF